MNLSSRSGAGSAEHRNAGAAKHAARLRECLHEMGCTASWTWPPAVTGSTPSAQRLLEHLTDASLDLPEGVRVTVSVMQTGCGEVGIYTFMPPQATQWVLLLHGYLLHSLCQASCIDFLVRQGYAVLAIDWPGHGLSEGRRASIDSFQHYAEVMDLVCKAHAYRFLTAPHVIAHSTGGSAWLEYQRMRSIDPFGEVILVAPLLRNSCWHLSRLGVQLCSRWTSAVPRVFRNSTSDPDFLRRMRSDPLAPWSLPLKWSHALIEWEADFAGSPVSDRPLWVLQGDQDSVVDWRFGTRRIQDKFPNAQIQLWKGQKHDLLNEAQPQKERIFRQLLAILEGCLP